MAVFLPEVLVKLPLSLSLSSAFSAIHFIINCIFGQAISLHGQLFVPDGLSWVLNGLKMKFINFFWSVADVCSQHNVQISFVTVFSKYFVVVLSFLWALGPFVSPVFVFVQRFVYSKKLPRSLKSCTLQLRCSWHPLILSCPAFLCCSTKQD